MSVKHKLLSAVIALGLIGTVATVVAPSAGAAASTCSSKSQGDGQTRTDCVSAVSVVHHDSISDTYEVYNGKSGKATGHCIYTSTKSWTFSVSSSVKAEAGLIFTHVSAEVTGGVSHTTTVTKGVSIDFPMAAHERDDCEWGHTYYSFHGTLTTKTCAHGSCGSTVLTYFSGTAPTKGLLRVVKSK